MENAGVGLSEQLCGYVDCRQPAVRSVLVGLRMEGHWAIEGSWVRRRVFLCEKHKEVLAAQTGAFSFRLVPAAVVQGDGAAATPAVAERATIEAAEDGGGGLRVSEEATEETTQPDHLV